MIHLRLPIRMLSRAASSDDACGEHLVGLVREAIGRGSRGAVAVVVRAERTELIELHRVIEAKLDVSNFLAGLTRSDPEPFGPPLAVGLCGRFQLRSARQQRSPVALVFLEWPDCRWWQWSALLDSEGQLVPDSDTWRKAVDGDPLPGGLGRWWTLGRRTKSTIRYGSAAPEPPAPALVH